jgi:DNA polymerase-3 subunit beta
MSATNLEIAISTWIGAEIQEEGAITVPARLLTDFINSLSKQTLSVTSTTPGKGIHLKGDRVDATINGADAAEFPPIPSVEDGIATRVDSKVIREAIHQVVLAAAVEDSRPVLTGVNVELEGTSLTLAAADGFRLAVHKSSVLDAVPEKLSVIVPARTLQEVERLIEGDDPIEILVTPQRSQILFKLKNVEIVSQLIQGAFPNYSQLVPQEHTTRVVVDLGELQRATRTASIFAKDGSGIIRIQMSPGANGAGTVTISSRAEELGDNTGEIEAEVEGEEGKIAFNSRYLSDVLAVLGKEKVAMEMTTSSSPGVIKPVDTDNYIHVVMPMFVQW